MPGEAGTAFLVCDHASNRVPWLLGNLGLEPAQLADHISWYCGAGGKSPGACRVISTHPWG